MLNDFEAEWEQENELNKPFDLPYWDHIKEELKNPSIYNKAVKFVRAGCVKYDGLNTWLVGPLEGYNTRTYIITKIKNDVGEYEFKCSCQGFNKNALCSHSIAVKLHAGVEQRNKKILREAPVVELDGSIYGATPGVVLP